MKYVLPNMDLTANEVIGSLLQCLTIKQNKMLCFNLFLLVAHTAFT